MKQLDITNFLKMNILYPLKKWRGFYKKQTKLFLKTVLFSSLIIFAFGFKTGISSNILSTIPFPEVVNHFFMVNSVDAGFDVVICEGDSVQLLATGGSNYTWTPIEGLSCINCADPIASPDTTTLYFVMAQDTSGQICTDSLLVTVSTPPQIDSVLTTNLSNCDSLDGSIVIFASGGTGNLEYSIDNGINWQADSSFSNLTAGDFNIAVRNDNNSCEITGDTITLSAPNAPIVTNIITNDPTQCDLPNGTIIISASGGVDSFQYSITGGLDWQISNTFQFLGSGLYQIAIRNADSTCVVSGGTTNLTATPDEPNITDIAFFHPTDCDSTDGMITIIVSNASNDFEYSVDSGAVWQVSNVFTGLSEGLYEILARKNDQTCVVNGGIVNLVEPAFPLIDSLISNDPTDCNVNDGIIVIAASGGSGFLEYSIDSAATWQVNNSFSTLSAGDYDIAVRNTNSNCIVHGNSITLQFPNDEPDINSIDLFDPSDCVTLNGSIIITATPCGNNILEYSIDGGFNWQLSGAFAGLGEGNYPISVRNQGAVNIVSGGIVALSTPPNPVINEIQSTQPTCVGDDGTLIILATGNGGDLEYTIDGGNNWQSSDTFNLLSAGNYVVIVRFPNSPCESDPQNASLTASDGPSIDDIIVNPDCGNGDGSITILASGNGNLEYTIDGGTNWDTLNFYGNLNAGTYLPGVRQVVDNCETLSGNLAVPSAQSPEITGVTFTSPTDCGVNDASITIITSNSGNEEFSIDGGNNWLPNSIFSNLPPGDYNIFVRNIDGTCPVASVINPLTISEPDDAPSIDNLTSSDPSECGLSDGFIIISASGIGTIEYSIDSGANFQLDPTFINLGPGDYDILVRFQGNNCVNTSNVTLNGQAVCTDTIQVSIPFETTTLSCIDTTVFQISGTITSSNFCPGGFGNPNTVLAAALDEECITLDPADGFEGISPDLICVVHCFNNDTTACDTTYIQVTVEPEDCDNLILEEMISLPFEGNPTEVCVPLPISQVVGLDLVLNGAPYNETLLPCDQDSVVVYTYSFLFGGGFDGPYSLDSWFTSLGTFSAQFNTVVDLVDSMNVFDPSGNWIIDIGTSSISGGGSGVTYGDMNITHIASNTQSLLMTNFAIFANGTIINIDEIGIHEFVVIDPNDGCQDTLIIELTGGNVNPVTDTIIINNLVNTPTDDICVNGDELPGGFNSLGFCELPENGNVNFSNDSCVVYIPVLDFIGKDTFCLLACDNGNPQVCDSTIVIVCVEAQPPNIPTDTLVLNIPINDPVDTCLTDLIQLPGNIDSTFFCGLDTFAMAATLNGDCINLDPIDGIAGNTEVCVVHCDDSNPVLCDTTIIQITITPPDPCANVDIISEEQITVQSYDVPTDVCIPISNTIAQLLSLELDGVPYNDPLTPCTPAPPATDGTIISVNGVGNYQLVLTNLAGCSDTLEIIVEALPIIDCDTIFANDSLSLLSQTGIEDLCIDISLADTTLYDISVNGVLFSDTLIACNNQAGTQITLNGFGFFEVVISDTTNCADTLVVEIIEDMQPPDCDPLFAQDTISLSSANGSGNACLPVSVADTLLYNIFVDGVLISDSLVSCNNQLGTQVSFDDFGFYEIIIIDTLDCADTLILEIFQDVMPPDCDPIFQNDSLSIVSQTGMEDICLPIPFVDSPNYDFLINGAPYSNVLAACNNQQGTQIIIDGFGFFEVVVTDTLDCSDTLLVEVIEEILPPGSMDTIYVTTTQGVTIDDICVDGDDLADPIEFIGFCQLPGNGTAPVVGDSCVSYIPAPILIGFDEFCIVVCDGNVPPNCDTTYVIVTVLPPIDTVFVDAPGVMPFDTCLTSNDLQLPGNLVNAEICDVDNAEVELTLVNECITIDLANNFNGTTQACVVHCDDNNPAICDTTILVITNAEPCDDIFGQDSLLITSQSSTNEVCIPIPPTEIGNYNLGLDGAPYAGGVVGCDADSVYMYSYSIVFGQGNTGPYAITWTANGQMFQDTVQDIAELVDSMNVWDPAGNWMDASTGNSLLSTNDTGDYGQLVWVHLASTITTTVQPVLTGMPMGTAVSINGYGDHILTIQDPSNGCEDTLFVSVVDAAEVIDITTLVNVVSDTFCLDTTNLSGVNAFIICESPANGTINIIGFDCFTYTPNPDYVGDDEACVAVCDTTGFCDTTIVSITVLPMCSDFDHFSNDTLELFTDNCQLPAEYCTPIPLDSIFGYSILDNGMIYDGGLAGCENDTCLAYTYITIPGLGDDGPYFLNSWTITGLGTFSGQFEDLNALVDSMNLWDDAGSWVIDTNMFFIRNCDTNNDYSNLDIDQIATGANAVADLNTQLFPNGSLIQLDTGFHEMVFIHMMSGCEDTLYVQVNCDEDTTGCGIMALSPDLIEVDDCDTTVQFCVDISIFDIGNFTVTDNGLPYTGNIETCGLDPNSVAFVLDTGFHELVLADTVKGCSDTFNIIVTCQMIQDVVINTIIPQNETEVFCLEDYGFEPSLIDSVTLTCIDMMTGNVDFVVNENTWCLELTGLFEGFDTACFKVYIADTCATVTVFAEVTAPCTQDLFDIDAIGANLTDCSTGLGDVCLPITLLEIQNQLIEVNGVLYPGVPTGCDFDSTFTINCALLPSMGNLGPYILDKWTVNGVDTLTGVFEDCQELADLMNMLDPTGDWVFIAPSTIVGGNPSTLYGPLEVTQDATGAEATLGINSSFVPLGTQITLPVGTFSLTFQDTLTGCRDTLLTTLACLDSEIFMDTVSVGETDTLCLDTSELGDIVSISNACEEASGEFVLFEIISDTCIQYFGIEPGLDTACIILCDDLGLCDTTYVFVLTQIEDDMLPVAVNDTVVTGSDQPININVFGNDTIISPTDFFILNEPIYGDATFLPDGSVNYVPDPGICEVTDTFTYIICNFVGCDTATVFVFIECTEFEIFTGFSPNGDGINDVLRINGLNMYASHKLTIFNRWGTEVYQSTNYANDWQGTWNGKDLPDGTYFYVLELEGTDPKKGYVQLQR